MIYYIESDGVTVTEHASISTLKRDYMENRMFAVHPDANKLITKADTGRYVYTSPTGVSTFEF